MSERDVVAEAAEVLSAWTLTPMRQALALASADLLADCALTAERDAALAAVERVRALHRRIPIRVWFDDCPERDLHECHESDYAGEFLCFTCPPVGWACDDCNNGVDDEPVDYPCPTILALDGEAK